MFEYIDDPILISIYINKYFKIDINNIDEFIGNGLVYLIKKQNQILGVIIFLDKDIKENITIKKLYFESKLLFLQFIDYNFKNGIKTISILFQEKEDKLITFSDIKGIDLPYSINYIIKDKKKIKVINIYYDVTYDLLAPKNATMEIYTKKDMKITEIINFVIELRKHKNHYYIFINHKVKILKSLIDNTYCNIYIINKSDKNKIIIYNNCIEPLVSNVLGNDLLFFEPIKLNTKSIKKYPFNNIYEVFVKNCIVNTGLPEEKYYECSYINNIKEHVKEIYIENNKSIGYLYIIKERKFVKSNEPVYKIGCTGDIKKRFNQYPKNSRLVFYIADEDFRKNEKRWIDKLNNNIHLKKRKDIGLEYFEGNYIIIINELISLIEFSEHI